MSIPKPGLCEKPKKIKETAMIKINIYKNENDLKSIKNKTAADNQKLNGIIYRT
jgi:hypothetical protein